MSDSNSLASRIRTLREQRKLTQAALAAEIGISRAHVTKIERGADAPGRTTLMAMATYFDVSLNWLAEGKGSPANAEASTEKEALLLFAFRQMPEEEADAHLNLMLRRVKGNAS